MGRMTLLHIALPILLLAVTPATSTGRIADKLTAQWRGPIGWPFECPLKTRLIWMPEQMAETSGSRQMPQGPLLGQGDLGMTILSDEGQYPSGGASGEIAMMLGANQMWALSDNDWSKCHYDDAHCAAVGLNFSTGGCWLGWVPGCSFEFPRVVALGGLNISLGAAFQGTGSIFEAEQRMEEGAVMAGYRRSTDNASLITRSVMLDDVKAMLTDITFSAPPSTTPLTLSLELWSYLMTVNTSLTDPTINTTVLTGVDGDGATSWFVRKSLPDSWNATAQISAAVGMTVMGSTTRPFVSSATSVKQLLTLHPGETVSVVVAVHTSIDAATASNDGVRPPAPWKQHDALPITLFYLNGLRNHSTAVATMRATNRAWWTEYWSRSSISLPSEPLIEFYWHAAQYALGSSSRPGKAAPGLYGPWVTNDLPAWHGDYTMDYNQQAIYYGAHSSNHAAQTAPEVELLTGYLPGAAAGARDLMHKFKKSCVDDDPGLTFPSHLGPYGYASAIGPSPNGDQRIRWNGEFATSVLLWDWEYTHNITTLRTATWPLLTGFAKKWRCWLVRTPSVGAPDGYLLVNLHDSWGEQNQGALPDLINPTQPQAWLIRLFEFLPVMAAVLDEPHEPWWQEILDHLPPIATGPPDPIGGGLYWEQASNGLHPDDSLYALFPAETADVLGRFGQYSRNATTGVYSIDTSTASAHADRAQLLAANTTVTRSTIAVGNNSENKTVFWSPTAFVAARGVHDWPQAARVAAARPSYGASSCILHSWGAPADRPMGDLVQCLNLWLEITMRNGTFRVLPFFAQGMLENVGVTQAINDMLLTSHGYGLRLFPTWAALRPGESASFRTLRAKGAFLVSADYNGALQRVVNVTIVSEAGMLCRVLSPWGDRVNVAAVRTTPAEAAGTQALLVPVDSRRWLEFPTVAGQSYSVSPAGGV